MVGVDKDDLEVLVGGVLRSPVRVEHAEVAAALADALLSDAAERAGRLQELDTLVLGLAVDDTLGVGALGRAAADADAVDDVALLSLVAEAASLVGARGASAAVDHVELAKLPSAHAEDEAHHIGLLLLPELFQILVGTFARRR